MAEQLNIVVTGAAGFIGWKVCEFLLTKPDLFNSVIAIPTISREKQSNSVAPLHPGASSPLPDSNGVTVIGIDNLNDYYDVRLKQWRLDQLKKLSRHCEESSDEAISRNRFIFHHLDIENHNSLRNLFREYSDTPALRHSSTPFLAVINLAARAGVRYSLENPFVYYMTNIIGNLNLLELCREFAVKKYVLASSSSLYAGQKMPFKEDLPVNEPISPYAASKKAAEVTCYTYHKLYDLDVTILRYFTVYGPASRPDMSPLRFISWVYQGKPVTIYGDGNQSRDFTYVDDIARGTILSLKRLGFEIINLGGDHPVKLIDFLHMIEDKLGKKARIVHEPSHPADMEATWAEIDKAKVKLNWRPEVNIQLGIDNSVQWIANNKEWLKEIRL